MASSCSASGCESGKREARRCSFKRRPGRETCEAGLPPTQINTRSTGPRGGVTGRRRSARTTSDTEAVENIDPVAVLDAILDGASDLPPEADVGFEDGAGPLSFLLIDAEEVG